MSVVVLQCPQNLNLNSVAFDLMVKVEILIIKFLYGNSFCILMNYQNDSFSKKKDYVTLI